MRKWMVLGLALLLTMVVAATASADSAGGFGGGGPLVGALRISLDDLNKNLVANNYEPLNGDMLFVGGGGAGGTLYWNVGGWGMGGEVTSTNGTKEAHLSIGLGGFNVQHTLPIGPFALTTGMLVGGGTAELDLINRDNPTLNVALGQYYQTSFKNDFFALAPSAGLRVKLADFVFVQAEGLYLVTVGDWKFQEHVISGLPTIGGPMVKVGVVFGGSSK